MVFVPAIGVITLLIVILLVIVLLGAMGRSYW